MEHRQQRQLYRQCHGRGVGFRDAIQSLEATFQQDFNADGTTGLKTTTIETAGATRLDQVANEFFLQDGAGTARR